MFGRLVCNVLGASIVGTCHSRHLASIYAYLCRKIHKNPKLSRLDLDDSATREIIVFLVSTSIAASVEELTIGSYEPLRKQDIADLEVPQLLQAAGMSLRALCITLTGSDEESENAARPPEKSTSVTKDSDAVAAGARQMLIRNACPEQLVLRIKVRDGRDFELIYTLLCQNTSNKPMR